MLFLPAEDRTGKSYRESLLMDHTGYVYMVPGSPILRCPTLTLCVIILTLEVVHLLAPVSSASSLCAVPY